MELTREEQKKLERQVHLWRTSPRKNIELEACFGFEGSVDQTTFLRVANRLAARGFKAIPQPIYMTIKAEKDGVRFRLDNEHQIQNYCRDNKLVGKPFTAMVKDTTMTEEEVQVKNVDLPEYSVRVKMRREVLKAERDPEVQKALKDWPTKLKHFRIIQRWTYEHAEKGVKFELSMVRSTRPMERREGKALVYNFQEQNLITVDPTFEIEVEMDQSKYPLETTTDEQAFKGLIAGIGEILKGIQNNTLLMRKSTKTKVYETYKKLTGLTTLEFRGVNPKTLQVENIEEDPKEGVENLRSDYNVTDKADGLRVHGIVDEDGELFLMDMQFNVMKTNLRCSECANSLLDGEYITELKHVEGEAPRATQDVLWFDIYKVNGKDCYNEPFSLDEHGGRYFILKDWCAKWVAGNRVVRGKSSPFTIGMKTFYNVEGTAEKRKADIFTQAGDMLKYTLTRDYNTDGLIFTANGAQIPEQAGAVFPQQFKWKPASMNTIDFLGEYAKDDDKQEIVRVGIHPTTGETVSYKRLTLFVGSTRSAVDENPRMAILQGKFFSEGGRGEYKPVPFNPTEFEDPMARVCYVECEISRENLQPICKTEAGEIIRDKSILEMRYDPSRPAGWRWIPMRVRYDKTARFMAKMIMRSMNGAGTAQNVWNSIHEPITEYMITHGTSEPSDAEKAAMAEVGLGATKGSKKQYFVRPRADANTMKVKGLRDFHNKYIKDQILYGAIFKRGSGQTIIDFAVGQGQDLKRWVQGKAKFALGVDIDSKCCSEPKNGAYARLLSLYREASKARTMETQPIVFFSAADSALPLKSGEAGADEVDKLVLRTVFGNDTGASELELTRLQKYGPGAIEKGADTAVCNFAIHYFFKSKETFDGLLRNIAATLKVGGYFIGCGFDGERVFDKLRDKKKGESISGVDSESTFWTITKQYEGDELTVDDTGFGHQIDVNFLSIGTTQSEYLVPFQLLRNKFKSIGLDLLNADELAQVGLEYSTNFFENSYKMAEAAGQKFEMIDALKEYSFLNRWYIFKRRAGGPGVTETAVGDDEEVGEESGEAVEAVSAEARAVAKGVSRAGTESDFMPSLVDPRLAAAAKLKAELADAYARGDQAKIAQLNQQADATGMLNPAVDAGPPGFRTGRLIQKLEQGEGKEPDVGKVPKTLEATLGRGTKTLLRVKETAKDEDFNKIPEAVRNKLAERYRPFALRYLAPNQQGDKILLRDIKNRDDLVYPSITHYMAAMRFKYGGAADQAELFSAGGAIHQKYALARQKVLDAAPNAATAANITKLNTKKTKDLAAHPEKAAEIEVQYAEDRLKLEKKAADKVQTSLNKLQDDETREIEQLEHDLQTDPTVGYKDSLFVTKQKQLLADGITQRLRTDKKFCAIVDWARENNLYIQYDRKNWMGKEYGMIIMRLVLEEPALLKACLANED